MRGQKVGSRPSRKGMSSVGTVQAGAPVVSGSSSSLSGTINAVAHCQWAYRHCHHVVDAVYRILIAPDVRAVQYDKCQKPYNGRWKCTKCLGLTNEVYDRLLSVKNCHGYAMIVVVRG